MTTIEMGTIPVCPDCESTNLLFEGQLQWNETTRDWEVVTEPDFWLCRNCDDNEMRLSPPNYVLGLTLIEPQEKLCVSGECPTCGSDNIEVDTSKTVYEADVIYVTLRCHHFDPDPSCPTWENRFDIVSTEVE